MDQMGMYCHIYWKMCIENKNDGPLLSLISIYTYIFIEYMKCVLNEKLQFDLNAI